MTVRGYCPRSLKGVYIFSQRFFIGPFACRACPPDSLLRGFFFHCNVREQQEALADMQDGMLALQEVLERTVDATRGLLERAEAAAAEAEGGEVSNRKRLCRGAFVMQRSRVRTYVHPRKLIASRVVYFVQRPRGNCICTIYEGCHRYVTYQSATHRTHDGASGLLQVMPTCAVKTRCALRRHCRDAMTYGQ